MKFESWYVFLLIGLLAVSSFACSNDDDDTPIDDDDLAPPFDFITCSTTCPGERICDPDGSCREPVYPVLRPLASMIPHGDGVEHIIENGRLIRPVGPSVHVGQHPTNLAVSPDGKLIVVNWMARNGKNLSTIDPDTWTIRESADLPKHSMFWGLTFNADGSRLFVSGGEDGQVFIYAVDDEHKLVLERSIPLPECYVADAILSPAETHLYVSCILESQVRSINLADESQIDTWDAGNRPHTMVISQDGARLFVSNWSNGVYRPDHDSVTVIDTTNGQMIATVEVGLGPEGLVISPDGKTVYSMGSKSDDIWAIDTATLEAQLHVSLVGGSENLKGIMPLGGAITSDGKSLYVAGGGEHVILVVDLETQTVKGRIPVEQYPNSVRLSPDETQLYTVCARGRSTNNHSVDDEETQNNGYGTVVKVDVPNEATLAQYTQTAMANLDRALEYYDLSEGNDTPVPSEFGEGDSPIKYVFWIMKENAAYDSIFGDMEIGNGDPELTFYGEEFVPNQRAIARQFTLFDAFFCESSNSVTGHIWAENASLPDWAYKANRSGIVYPTPGFDLGTISESLPVMAHFYENGISVRAFGTGEQFGGQAVTKYSDLVHPTYPLVATLAYQQRDREKARIFIDDFKKGMADGTWPQFIFLSLPNNHGDGLKLGKPTPASMTADNDEGLGMIVETIAQSEIWDRSLIFVFEDDAQHGYDHVNGRRIAATAVSPWIKHGYVSSVMYSYMAMFKTTELIFGVPPLTRFDERVHAMYDIFRAKPDLEGYEKVDRLFPEELWDGESEKLSAESALINWDELDKAEGAAELFWRYRKGTEPPARYIKY